MELRVLYQYVTVLHGPSAPTTTSTGARRIAKATTTDSCTSHCFGNNNRSCLDYCVGHEQSALPNQLPSKCTEYHGGDRLRRYDSSDRPSPYEVFRCRY